MRSSHTEGAIDKLRTEQAWLLEQKRTAETGILHLQTTGVDMSSKLDMLQKKHQSILDDLAFERDRVKVRMPFSGTFTTQCGAVVLTTVVHIELRTKTCTSSIALVGTVAYLARDVHAQWVAEALW